MRWRSIRSPLRLSWCPRPGEGFPARYYRSGGLPTSVLSWLSLGGLLPCGLPSFGLSGMLLPCRRWTTCSLWMGSIRSFLPCSRGLFFLKGGLRLMLSLLRLNMAPSEFDSTGLSFSSSGPAAPRPLCRVHGRPRSSLRNLSTRSCSFCTLSILTKGFLAWRLFTGFWLFPIQRPSGWLPGHRPSWMFPLGLLAPFGWTLLDPVAGPAFWSVRRFGNLPLRRFGGFALSPRAPARGRCPAESNSDNNTRQWDI